MNKSTLVALAGGLAIGVFGDVVGLQLFPTILLCLTWGIFVTSFEQRRK